MDYTTKVRSWPCFWCWRKERRTTTDVPQECEISTLNPSCSGEIQTQSLFHTPSRHWLAWEGRESLHEKAHHTDINSECPLGALGTRDWVWKGDQSLKPHYGTRSKNLVRFWSLPSLWCYGPQRKVLFQHLLPITWLGEYSSLPQGRESVKTLLHS